LKQALKDSLYSIELYVLNNLYIANKVDRLKKLDKKRNGSLELGDLVFSGNSGSAHKLKIENNDKSHTTLKLRNAMKFYDFCLTHNLDFKPYEREVSIKNKFLDFLPGWFEVEFIDEKDRTFTSLSAGEKSFYILLTTLIYQIDNIIGRQKLPNGNYNNILILLDEADLGLHPKWQREYLYNIVETLKQFSSKLNYQVICTSHSPFIVSDLPKNNILFLNDGKVDNLKDNEHTFGENIHTLLNDSFFMQKSMMMGKIAENKIKHAFDFFDLVFTLSKKKQYFFDNMVLEKESTDNFNNEDDFTRHQASLIVKKLSNIHNKKIKLSYINKSIFFKYQSIEKKILKKQEEYKSYDFESLSRIIGEQYIKISLKNSIKECETIFNIEDIRAKNIDKIRTILAGKDNDALIEKWLKDLK